MPIARVSRHARVSRYLARRVPVAGPDDRVSPVLAGLPGQFFDTCQSVWVLGPERRLLGAVDLNRLYAAGPDQRLGDLMVTGLPVVREDSGREEAASLAIHHELGALPVVNAAGEFLGVFPARAMMRTLRAEHLEDLHHMAGIWHHSEEARAALEAPPLRRIRYRLPWLLLGLAGSGAATAVMARFETTLEAQLALAFFVPGIVYMADAVGTQSEAVAVRGLSLTTTGLPRLLVDEITSGVLIGIIMAVVAGAFSALAFGDLRLSLVVALALLGACTVATTIGLLLPWLFQRVGWDPALASGPLATIIQDVLSLLIYFAAAAAILL